MVAVDQNRAMILAAGRARRLKPLSADRAKAVVPFLNRPLLDFTLDWLRRCGYRQVVINLHHEADSIRGRYGAEWRGLSIVYSPESTLLGTAGGPRRVRAQLGERLLLINGDIATGIGLGPLVAHHNESGALATLALYRGPQGAGYPIIEAGPEGRIRRLDPAPVSGATEPEGVSGCFCGIQVLETRLLDVVPADTPCGIVDSVYREMLALDQPLHGSAVVGPWYEIGEPRRYLQAQLRSLARQDLPLAYEGYRRSVPAGYLRPGTDVGRVGLVPPYLLDSGIRLCNGVYLRGVVAGADCSIETGASVEETILWPGSKVCSGARLRRAIVLEDAIVPPDTEAIDVVWTRSGPHPLESAGTRGSAGGDSLLP